MCTFVFLECFLEAMLSNYVISLMVLLLQIWQQLMGLQTSGDPSPPDESRVLPPGFNHFVTCPDRKKTDHQGVLLDKAEDYCSVWESVPGTPTGRPLSGGLLLSRPVSGVRPEWEGELATSFEWQRHLDGDRDRDSASGTMPKSAGPG